MKLTEYQQAGVQFILDANGRALLCDDPGLGKTAQAVTAIDSLQGYPCLVVCPSGARLVWPDEWALWASSARSVHVVRSSKEQIPEDAEVLVVSFDLAIRRRGTLEATAWRSVIVDEFHAIKNKDAKRSQAVLGIAKRAEYCLMLSGTPMLNRPMELWPPLSAVWRLGDKLCWKFYHKYCGAERKIIGKKRNPQFPKQGDKPWVHIKVWDFTGASNVEQLHEVLKPVMLRRRIDDVARELPELRRIKWPVPDVSVPLDQLREICFGALNGSGWNIDVAMQSIRSTMRRAAESSLLQAYGALGVLKVGAVCELIDTEVSSENPTIIFAHTVDAIKSVTQFARGAGLRVEAITGGTPLDERKDIERRFHAGELDLAVLSIMAANAATTWTRANQMFFLQMPWSSEIARQCEGRMRRKGQSRPMIAKYLVANDELDEALWKMLNDKARVVAQVIDGASGVSSGEAFAATDADGRWAVVRLLLEEMVASRQQYAARGVS